MVLGAWLLSGCGGDKRQEEEAPPTASAAATSSAQKPKDKGAEGAGDKSGKDVANAAPLSKASPASFTLKCGESRFFGPFHFHSDKEELEIAGQITSESGEQTCGAGDCKNSRNQFLAVTGLPCIEGKEPAKGKLSILYDPKSGGMGANPVFLRVSLAEMPCAPSKIELTGP